MLVSPHAYPAARVLAKKVHVGARQLVAARGFYTNSVRDNPKVSPWNKYQQEVVDEEQHPTKVASHADLKWAKFESEGKVVSPPSYEKMGSILNSDYTVRSWLRSRDLWVTARLASHASC